MVKTPNIFFPCVAQKDRLQEVSTAELLLQSCSTGCSSFSQWIALYWQEEKTRPTKKSKAASCTSVPLLCTVLVLSKVNIFLPSLVCGEGGRGCGIYPAFTNKTKIKLNSFYFNLHRLWLFNLHKYGLQEVLNFSCPGLKLVESKI